jgi:hypothetical protein
MTWVARKSKVVCRRPIRTECRRDILCWWNFSVSSHSHTLLYSLYSSVLLQLPDSEFDSLITTFWGRLVGIVRLRTKAMECFITTLHGPHRKHVLRVRMRVHWSVSQHWAWRGLHRKHFSNTFSIVACAYFGLCLEMDLHVTLWGKWWPVKLEYL